MNGFYKTVLFDIVKHSDANLEHIAILTEYALGLWFVLYLIIYMKKFIHFDWLRAVQFLGNTVPKKEIQCQKRKLSANFSRF